MIKGSGHRKSMKAGIVHFRKETYEEGYYKNDLKYRREQRVLLVV